jgi:glycosyltransferase involved in cell wall biosynthesis
MQQVSCLMITLDRFEQFRSSYLCYCNQTYPHKELVIVTDGEPAYQQRIQDFIEQDGRSDVRLIKLQTRLRLGALRNIAVDEAAGPLVCQWDDDDLYHPRRLQDQVEYMLQESADVTFLTDQLQLFWNNRHLYWCDWRQPQGFDQQSPFDCMIPGTLLANKRHLPRYKPDLKSSEDLDLLKEMIAAGTPMAGLGGKGWLYIYTYHGKNTFEHSHHEFITMCYGITRQQLEDRAATIASALAHYPIEAPLYIIDREGHETYAWDGRTLALSKNGKHLSEAAVQVQQQPQEKPAQKVAGSLSPEKLALLVQKLHDKRQKKA